MGVLGHVNKLSKTLTRLFVEYTLPDCSLGNVLSIYLAIVVDKKSIGAGVELKRRYCTMYKLSPTEQL